MDMDGHGWTLGNRYASWPFARPTKKREKITPKDPSKDRPTSMMEGMDIVRMQIRTS